MNFVKHSELKGSHALFSPSQNSWLRYDDDKVVERVRNQYRTALGTELHEYVASQIELSHKVSRAKDVAIGAESYIYTKYQCGDEGKLASYGITLLKNLGRLPKEVFDTARLYINDGILYRMNVEQTLLYSEYFFGTADTISFRDGRLRIHDFKSGDTPAHFDQLMVYAALFCLEYAVKPKDVEAELRIYQAGEANILNPDPEEIMDIADRIVSINRLVEKTKSKEA